MTDPTTLPAWAAVMVALFLVCGSAVTLLGSIGLVRLRTFYQRVHAPTLATSLGGAFVLLASALFSVVGEGRPILHETLILVFLLVTTPITLMLLARAALYRDRAEGSSEVPPAVPLENGDTSAERP